MAYARPTDLSPTDRYIKLVQKALLNLLILQSATLMTIKPLKDLLEKYILSFSELASNENIEMQAASLFTAFTKELLSFITTEKSAPKKNKSAPSLLKEFMDLNHDLVALIYPLARDKMLDDEAVKTFAGKYKLLGDPYTLNDVETDRFTRLKSPTPDKKGMHVQTALVPFQMCTEFTSPLGSAIGNSISTGYLGDHARSRPHGGHRMPPRRIAGTPVALSALPPHKRGLVASTPHPRVLAQAAPPPVPQSAPSPTAGGSASIVAPSTTAAVWLQTLGSPTLSVPTASTTLTSKAALPPHARGRSSTPYRTVAATRPVVSAKALETPWTHDRF